MVPEISKCRLLGKVYAKARINMTSGWDDRGVFFGLKAFVNTNCSPRLQDHSE